MSPKVNNISSGLESPKKQLSNTMKLQLEKKFINLSSEELRLEKT